MHAYMWAIEMQREVGKERKSTSESEELRSCGGRGEQKQSERKVCNVIKT